VHTYVHPGNNNVNQSINQSINIRLLRHGRTQAQTIRTNTL